MSKFFTAALLVSLAAAEVTTTAWLPGTGSQGMSYSGSVVSVDGARTVMIIAYPEEDEELASSVGPQTITMEGNTYVEYQASATEQDVAVTISAACSRQDTNDVEATCTMSTLGLDDALSSLSSLCNGPQSAADYCSEASDFSTSETTTLPEGYFGMIPVIVTAGDDLLPAATPSAGSASQTKVSESGSVSPTASGSVSGSASGIGAAKTSAASAASKINSAASSAAAEQSTAGAPMMTMAPAVAALGAAAAFFL